MRAPIAVLTMALSLCAAERAAFADEEDAPRPAPRKAEGFPVHFDADEPNARLLVKDHRVNDRGRLRAYYKEVCIAPCDATLDPREYEFALALPNGSRRDIPTPVTINGPTSLQASYVSHSGTRAAGIVITSVGSLTGIVLAIVGAVQTTERCDSSGFCIPERSPNGTLIGLGLATLAVSVTAGVLMIVQRDEASIAVVPLQSAALPAAMRREGASLGATGAAVEMRF